MQLPWPRHQGVVGLELQLQKAFCRNDCLNQFISVCALELELCQGAYGMKALEPHHHALCIRCVAFNIHIVRAHIGRTLLVLGLAAVSRRLRSEEHTSELQSLMRTSYA